MSSLRGGATGRTGAPDGGLSRTEPRAALRRMAAEDVPAVVAIERASFSTPWTETTFRGLVGRGGIEAWVLEDEQGQVAGYAVFWHAHDQGELANIAVRPDRRGQGLGARLLDGVLAMARERGVESLFLEVRRSNDRALALYEGRGFRRVGVRRGYYRKPREDALVLMRTFHAGEG